MADERRQQPRLKGPYDGSWSGSAGTRHCRVTDLSAGGCFVDSFTGAEPGASLQLVLTLDEAQYTLPAEVVYIDRVQGFGVRFLPSDGATALARALESRGA
ncbi:MAG: PilZ domain-containing protein [Vicinamibacterales bacterium]